MPDIEGHVDSAGRPVDRDGGVGGRVLIVDYGSQYTQLIARRVRESGVYSEIFDYRRLTADALAEFSPCCVILSGGPESTAANGSAAIPESVFACGKPVLGICYGMQAMASQLGGVVESSARREFGDARLSVAAADRLLDGMENGSKVWMSHGDRVVEVPPGFSVIATTASSPIAAMADASRRYYGLQFHPEVTHTSGGAAILKRFVIDIAGCRPLWMARTIVHRAVEQIRRRVGDEHVVLGLSGGVDSAVAAALIHRAIGPQVHCVFVDTGLLRQGEAEQVADTFAGYASLDLIQVKAQDVFFKSLRGVRDPEEKRKIIGNLFITLFEEEARKLPQVKWLAQGTIYPDVIESSREAHTSRVIKSHHNVGGLPERMQLKLLEPLSMLFKDEVRKLGAELGLPQAILGRHPFPGPGFAVRVVGEVRKKYVELLRVADRIFIEELRRASLYDRVSQAFVVFLPVKSVSVMGDRREYSHVLVLRAVETSDFMTADRSHLPEEFLSHVARRIVNEVAGVSRVCYDVTSKPPATIEWE